VRRLPGQAARHAGVLLHRLAALAVALAVLGGAAIGALGWRLAQGPLELPWLTRRVEAALNQDATIGRVTIGSTALAWEGFRLGLDRPLDVRLNRVTFDDAAGRRILTVPRAELLLSLNGLLFGRTTLRALELDQARISLVRAADGSIGLGPVVSEPGGGEPGGGEPGAGEPGAGAAAAADAKLLLALLTELAKPPASDRSTTNIGPFSQLRRLRIHDAALEVVDRQLGTTWQAPHAEIDLTRRPEGGVDGSATVVLALGDEQARLTATATLPPSMGPPSMGPPGNGRLGNGPIRLRLRLTPVTPASIARVVPGAAALAALDAPIGAEADLLLDDAMRLIELHLTMRAGVGRVHVADGVLPITGATIVADATADHLELRDLRLTVPSHPGGADSILRATGWLDRAADHLTASLGIDLDRVDFADLPRLWPAGLGRGARAWITENITAGMAHDGHVELGLAAAPDFSAVTLTRATGTISGDGLLVSWLRPVPPIEDGSAVLNIRDPDTLEIVLRSGRQRLAAGAAAAGAQTPGAQTTGAQTTGAQTAGTQAAGTSGLLLQGGRMRITGLMHQDQFAAIEAQVVGTLPDALALLREPRLQLLALHPLPLNDPAGQVAGTLTLSLPLDQDVTMDQVAIRAHAHLDGAHLGGVIAGRDLDQGVLDLDATVDGLTLSGTAALAGIPASVQASMDFRAGGPGQVLQRVSVSGRPSARQLAAAGLDAGALLDGTLGLDATLSERRDGAGDIAVTADLGPATLAVAALAWRKPAGAAMTASGRLLLSHDRLTGIENILVSGDGVAATGRVACVGGKPSMVRLDRLVLGHTEARATIELPTAPTGQGEAAGPIAVSLAGPTLDLAARLAHQPTQRTPRGKREPPSGPHWTLDARFDRVIMAGDHEVTALVARADSDGGLLRRLELDGLTGEKAPFSVRIASAQGKRTLSATAANAGELLAGLDILSRMQGGQLVLTGSYDDTTPDHALNGAAEIADFRIRGAPVLARLLQAMTLYGLVEAVQGPGLGFSKLDAPFRLTEDTLTLTDARAFSSSLGLTARGTIDLDLQRATLEGTIVPAYFFNTLLGHIPLVGRLFSPEQGGGLFAASYAVRGPLDDPDVTVNPLTALTPGFLRGLFGLF
jgi:hypothetical protein